MADNSSAIKFVAVAFNQVGSGTAIVNEHDNGSVGDSSLPYSQGKGSWQEL